MSELLICRACQNELTAPESCAICELCKANLIVDDDGDPDSLAKVAGGMVRLMQTQLRQLRGIQGRTRGKYDERLANETRKHAQALSKLLDSARKVINDGVEAVEALSFQEKAALFESWFMELPQAYRRTLLAGLSKHVADVAVTVPAETFS